MNFQDYQHQAAQTAIYPKVGGHGFVYPVMGLAGEVGEVSEKLKKVIRDKNGHIDEATRAELAKELGDVMWYVAQLATELDLKLADVARNNIEKLLSRQERNLLKGDGDNR
jgi:NTP pyrophosphatase (non-canonical NTP hydrolase)